MDGISPSLDPDELMDLEEPEPYELDEDEDDIPDDPAASPFQQFSSGPASNATSTASSPANNEDFSTPYNFTGKPLTIKRGRGRPRREGGKPGQRRGGTGAPRVRRAKPPGVSRNRGSRSVRQPDRMDFEFSYISSNSMDDLSMTDVDSFFFPDRERPGPLFEELPYSPEAWPGKVCAFCNLGERSQLGQGEMMRLSCPEGFTPQRLPSAPSTPTPQAPDRDSEDKSPRGPVTCRRNKNFSRSRSFLPNNEHVDELSIIGHVEEPNVNVLFESNGYFYVHRNCALWSSGVTRAENQALENVGPIVLKSSSQKCSFCNHFGASLNCAASGCSRSFHFPCATASAAFQDLPTRQVFCNAHLGEAALCCESALCNTCKTVGDVTNLMYCSSCGTHYHGSCVGLAQLPGVRAGWQCRKCRSCQVCRMTGDETKLMSCEQCDKVYHASCQRPIVTSIPKYGWKCRCCRVCGDCGSRTPGAGLSSRWHLHYTVCDSCYQQRNKGCCCPVCQRAYRSHGHREMVQCASCRKFVHGTCDPEADLAAYQHKRELTPDYEYHCVICKNASPQQLQAAGRALAFKRSSTEDPGELSASQESLYDDMSEFDSAPLEETFRSTGLGKGKPYAGKLAKKKLSHPVGRPKGFGKGVPGKHGFMKRQRMVDFGRKRGAKAKIRGVFGVPGVGLSRPVADGKSDEEPGVENRLALCSAKDKFVLTQDICVMCGALGTDQEGCLISCVQCGQCYHPYCLNVKVTKVILQKGWRCLDCTVCEGCGQRNDEGRLILCDDCDVSYHTYCMDPPLDYVPHGNWKCKWCACCRTCGSADPGFNSTWMNGCTECGPCASLVACASCNEPYCEGDLIIQCAQCERWLHGLCDLVKTEMDAEKCAEDGYTCLLCRPRDVPPPHLQTSCSALKPPTPVKSPEVRSNAHFVIDGVALSESGHALIKSLSLEHHGTRKKRKKLVPVVHDKEAGIMATIESVVAGGSAGENSFEDTKIEMVDLKDEPQELYKEGMIWTKDDGPPPEGFTIFQMENGVCVLRRKRQRNLQKLGIGGFLVRMRGFKSGQENDDIDTLPGQTVPMGPNADGPLQLDGDKPKKKPMRRKPKSKLVETFPPYLQEAFFGKDLMDVTQLKQEVDSGASSEEEGDPYKQHAIKLSADELRAMETAKRERKTDMGASTRVLVKEEKPSAVIKQEEEDEDETNTDLKDVLALPGDLLDTDLVNSIIEDDELTKNTELDALADDDGELAQTLGSSEDSKDAKDELSDILGSHFSLESIPNINSKDVEDIFKGVLTDESQESQLSQESSAFPSMPSTQTPIFPPSLGQNAPPIPQMHMAAQVRPTTLPGVQHVSFPPSPYHSEYSNSPQFSPAFSEPPSPWVNMAEGVDMEGASTSVASTYNQRSSEKMKADEGLGSGATISAVLYANMNHPEWKVEQPVWTERYKQIIKKWRTLSQEQKAPYLQQARDNRSQLRMKKQQQSQTVKEAPAPPPACKPPPAAPALAAALETVLGPPPLPQPPQTSEVRTVCAQKVTAPQPLTRHASSSSSSSISPPPPSAPASHVPSSPPTHQQFTVHGQFAGPGDRVGPAPNVTVNPHYQPSANPCVDHRALAASDQQIRVLTPSEIMRTLPSLCQETYEQPDQEKLAQQQKTAREAEQERQWKQLQALRQQQAQQQQHVIHEQRVQAIARVQRTISDPGPPFLAAGQNSPLQVNTASQETSPVASPSPRQFMGIKSPPFTHPSPTSVNIRTPTPSQSPVHEFPAPPTPGPAHNAEQELFADQKSTGGDVAFGQAQPPLSRPSFPPARTVSQARPEQPEITRQLRDLLQRQQQLKSFEAQKQTRPWTSDGGAEAPNGEDITFRQPLPPSTARPRGPTAMVVRPPQAPSPGMRMPHLEGRLQSLDPRLRLILQQQPRMGTPAAVRFPRAAPRPASIEQYEQLMQRQAQLQARNVAMEQAAAASAGRLPLVQPPKQSPVITTGLAPVPPAAASGTNEQEIPDNVTAELEKLEQETGTMAELQGVSEILGGLGDDDDELLAEMGADFNILEYADPELEALAGEKTNILDLHLEDDNLKQEKKREQLQRQQQQQQQQQQPSPLPTSTAVCTPPTPTAPVTSPAPNRFESYQQAMVKAPAAPEPQPVAPENAQTRPSPDSTTPAAQTPAPEPPSAPPTSLSVAAQQIHQQMLHQVQQAAALGKPMPPGSKLQTPDGIVGVVLANNNVQLQIPPNFQQRLLLQLQNQKFQMRMARPVARPPSAVNQAAAPGQSPKPRMPTATPPPPPPYPGPPPPYPGNVMQQQMGLNMGLAHPGGLASPSLLGYPPPPTFDRRPLLLEEQPLLLEDLLEQEKREQEKQHQAGSERSIEPEPALLSDHDFERLKADVFSSEAGPSPWPPTRAAPSPAQHTTEITTRIQMFNANLMPAPPLPPDNAVSEQDKQAQIVYEHWLNHQNNVLTQQLRYYETEVQKLRKSRKSLNSKQRQLRKTGNQLSEIDAAEFQRISAEQAILQKHLESSRKQSRQHSMLVQEYRNKQQPQQKAPVGTSPIHHSPMMSPQRSPMNSPGPMVAHSPALLPSPGGSPGSTPSPSQVCLPPPASRMTSPQHRRVVTSPSYATELRNNVNPMRFMRPTTVVDHQRVRSQTPNPHQALLQKQLHQQALLHQQQGDANQAAPDGSGVLHSPRVAQLIQHRNLSRQQQQQMSPQQHQMAMQLQARLQQQQQQQAPPSPIMPPKSPLHPQPNMSPHSMPSSPMPPKSPLLGFNTPGSPAGRASYQPNSPMMMQYQPPSPLMRRPPSVENPRTPYSMDAHLPDPVPQTQSECDFRGGLRGGALMPPLGFKFSKPGLKGGAPMWGGFGRGEKRVPTPPTAEAPDSEFVAKPKKEPHISKVSILKKKTAVPKSSPKLAKEVPEFEADGAKKELPEMVVDFEDDNSSLLASEVSLSSAAQQNDDELEMTETLSQDDIGEVLASPMEADQISDEFLLFQGNMVVDLSGNAHYSDKEEAEEEYANIVIRSPTTSDDEFIMQGRTKKYNIMDVESPEPDTNTEPEDEEPAEESEVVIIDQAEEQISTKEDFEELIDEGSRKKTDFQKFTATSVYSFPPKPLVRPIVSKAAPKISLITPTIIQNFTAPEAQQLILTPTSKITTTSAGSKLTSIILTHNAMRSNLFKAGTASPGITIVSASTSQIASILPSKFTVPVISASAVRQLPNVKVIDKPSCVTTTHDCSLPKKIFEEDSENDEKKNVSVFVKKGDALVLANAQRKPIAVRKPVAPELKMTAQVIQETMQITATETVSGFEGSSEDKSVVISIPSPTPSQEQMLDNIALQALEDNRRREFESFEDVLDMIENMQHSDEQQKAPTPTPTPTPTPKPEVAPPKQAMPQLSPLSQPAELTSNMASASQQLRTLLSTLQTTATSQSAHVEAKPVNVVASRVIQKPQVSTSTSKGSLTLTAMLQNQPAATPTTKSSADTITAASLLATPVSLPRTSFSPSLAQAQPNAISVIAASPFRGNLLHTQLTKARTKSLDDIKDLKEEPEQDSQNVLLKKLLQNTACASTQSPPPSSVAEQPKSSPPTLASLLPPAKTEAAPAAPPAPPPKPRSLLRETSFVSNPVVQQLHVDVKKPVAREELLSPPTPDSSLQTPPLPAAKKEPPVEIKKELLDETSQHSEVSDQGKGDLPIKEEGDVGEINVEKAALDKEELKKQKRRMYNQKRRQNQMLNKEQNKPNKRPRKNSKLDEDYDSYIDNMLGQIRQLPPMVVSEPVLVRNYGVVPVFGAGDLSKIGTKHFDPRKGDLSGEYGCAVPPDCSDFYSTEPYGVEVALPAKPALTTQRGFYEQEFPLIKFDGDDDSKFFDMFAREDTPDSIVSGSSSDCEGGDGLRLISDDEEDAVKGRQSPPTPLLKPIAIRLKPSGLCVDRDLDHEKPRATPPEPAKDSENIKVTLTLTSSAAEDIVGVLRDLANILQIPPPTTYQIVDRTSSPAPQKLGMYRTKGKDGKEGAPIDIQSILNGAAKFCKHCDVVILNNLIRKRVSDLPFLDKELEGEELYFCGTPCYMQFALMHRSPSIPEEKAAALIDHLSQRGRKTEPALKQSEEPRGAFAAHFGSMFKQARFGLAAPSRAHRNTVYKLWFPGCIQPSQKHKKPTDKEMMEMLYQMGITVTPPKMPDDTRKCMFCQVIGDGVADGPARLLNVDVDKWVHLNCALWSDGVYETVNGALMNLENAMQQSLSTACAHCAKVGATIRCFKARCSNVYHLACAVRDGCVFFKNKTAYCAAHVPKNEKDNELTTLSVGRRVYVNRDENRQVAAVMHHSDTNNLLRVGSLIFLNVGQLMPHQLQNFHTPNHIYPIGYKIIRFYWSMRYLSKRCRYICSIQDAGGRPEFRVLVQEFGEEDVEFREQSPKTAWSPVLDRIAVLRREGRCLQMFPQFISGEDLFGLSEPAIVRVLESLPGIETLSDYKFKYGRNPLLELPLAINPTGAARAEPRLRHQTHWKRPHTQRTTGSSRPLFGPSASSAGALAASTFGESVCPYSKQFVHSKSSQYKKMKQEWRNNVYLGRSKIQGLGLYAARDLEKHTMVIEYIGEVIRTELSECREKQYEAKNRGIYMFRLDDDRVVDATLSGGLARYINHSCNPNCVAETVEIDRDLKIIIFSKRRIQRGEELAYDYKFDIEDDQNKISCMCGAPNCRKWMN